MPKNTLPTLLATTIILLPFFANADTGLEGNLIPCDGTLAHPCDLSSFIVLLNRVIRFLMIDIAVPLATLGFALVGARLIFSQEKESAWSEARESFMDIGKGFAMILVAFVLIKTVLFVFLSDQPGGYADFVRFFLN